MITPTEVRIAEFIIDSSGIVETFAAARRTSSRGRPADLSLARALFVGMFLSIHLEGKATLRDIHHLLTRKLCDTDKKRLKVLRNGKDITYTQLVSYSKTFKAKLAYGPSAGDIDVEDRAVRHATVVKAVNDLMDVFDLGWESGWYAIDATGLWSWARGTGTFTPGEPLDEDDPDADIDIDIEATPASGVANTSADPDATWMVKTSKGGHPEPFFGYHGHAIAQVPANNQNVNDEPRLLRRVELTTANADVVDVSLRLIDSLNGGVTDLVEDRHYNYKAWDRWHAPLNERGIRQHFDLRSDQQGFIEYDRMRWVAGAAHCPSTPDSHSVIPLPTRKSDEPRFHDAVAERQKYAMYVTERSDDGATQRVQCPALYGTVGCPLRAGTEATAIQLGQPIITNPPDPASPEGLPACCTQTKVSTTPPPTIRKTQQRYYWGSAKWKKAYNKRTYIEGVFGNLKNPSTENLSRDLTRGMGLPWMNLIVAMTAASYNLRILRTWHDETGKGPEDHPLLIENVIPAGFEYVDRPTPTEADETQEAA